MNRTLRNRELAAAAREGLSASPKRMSPKWFYDAAGSVLFEKITELPEYYPTRTEVAIIEARADELAACIPEGAALVELGSGASVKSRLLLDALPQLGAYVPVDISETFLMEAGARIAADYPGLDVAPMVADFSGPLVFSGALETMAKVAFFPGSTLGNLDADGARRLMKSVRDWPGIAGFILGVDLAKDEDVLVAAYDDSSGVTAAFNLNLLRRLNREAGAEFELDRFAHRVRWNSGASRIEMHLESLEDQVVRVDGTEIRFEAGETIHTENSHKYTPESLRALAAETGWHVDGLFTDAQDHFAAMALLPR